MTPRGDRMTPRIFTVSILQRSFTPNVFLKHLGLRAYQRQSMGLVVVSLAPTTLFPNLHMQLEAYGSPSKS